MVLSRGCVGAMRCSVGVVVRGSGGVQEWRCRGVAVRGSGGAWEVEVHGSGGALECWCMGVAAHESGGAWEWQCMGVAVHGQHHPSVKPIPLSTPTLWQPLPSCKPIP